MGNFVSSQAFLPRQHAHVRFANPSNVHFIDLPSSGVRVPLLHIRRDAREPTLVFAHGNAEDLMMLESFGEFLGARLNVNFCAFEYPGYAGTSWIDSRPEPLVPSEALTFEAAEGALDWLLAQQVPVERCVFYGRSLGSGSAVHLAVRCAERKQACGGLILQSPIASAVRVVLPNIWWTIPFVDIFANIDKVPRVQCRTTVIHGTADDVVPLQNGRALNDAIPSAWRAPPCFIEGAGHNDVELFTEQWLAHLAQFLRPRAQ